MEFFRILFGVKMIGNCCLKCVDNELVMELGQSLDHRSKLTELEFWLELRKKVLKRDASTNEFVL